MAKLRAYKKKANTQLTKNFNSSEFDCSCKACKETIIDLDRTGVQPTIKVLAERLTLGTSLEMPQISW
jgi:azurin